MRKGLQITVLLTMLVFLGLGCKQVGQKPPSSEDAGTVSDSGTMIPTGWKEYMNEEWKVSLALPSNWEYRERSKEEIGGQDILWVDFNSGPVIFREASDVVYPLSLTVSKKSLEEEISATQNIESRTTVVLGEKNFTKVTYRNDLVNDTHVVYFFVSGSRVYAIDGNANLSELDQVVATLEVK